MAKYPGPNDESIILPSNKPQPQASNKEWKMPTIAGISTSLNPWWNKILVTSCVIAVLFDPLFFYIPYTSEERKCMGSDKGVQTAALIFRSVTDVTFLVHIIYQLHVAITFAASRVSEDENLVFRYESVSRDQMIQFAKAFSHKLSWRSFLTDVLSILPLPQLLLVGLYFDIRGDDYLFKRKIILGAFWYFFAIQRETSCWYRTCVDKYKSELECTFYCQGKTTAIIRYEKLNATLDEQCILKVPYNMTDPPFDFGMFFDALKNDIQGKINVPQKIGYCFWWGLRNLSNFGTGLLTSTYLWENCFAVVISIVGLLLFLYLIGNVQVYMERATTRAEEVREKYRSKEDDIENWMENHGLEKDMKEEIRKNIKEKLEENISADLDNIYSILPKYTKKVVKRFVGMKTLRNVPMLSKVDGRVLKVICDYLQPVKYQGDTMVFRMGEPFDRMIFITDGSMWTYKTATESGSHSGQATGGSLATSSSTEAHFLTKGDAYGHMLLQLASSPSTKLPISGANVKCHTKVEAFVLMFNDLKNIVTACGNLWPSSLDCNAACQDQVAVPVEQFQQQQNLKNRSIATSTINPTGHKE